MTAELLTLIVFYSFSTFLLASAVGVIVARNAVHSVLFLIFAFFNSAGLFVLLGAEFLAMALVVVYVGAVALLFLFVVMMLDIDFDRLREGFWDYLPMGALVGLVLFAELVLIFMTKKYGLDIKPFFETNPVLQMKDEGLDVENTLALGRVLYTDYIYAFQIAGVILLVAMIGAIALGLQKQKNPRKQDIMAQNLRQKKDAIEIRKMD